MFAEAVIARRPGAQVNQLEHQWLEGLWVGRDGSTDEHLIASGGGIVRCRAVKRMTEDRRWLAARFGSFHWTPWAPSAVQRGRPPRIREDAEPIRVAHWDVNGPSCQSTSRSTSHSCRTVSADSRDRVERCCYTVQLFFLHTVSSGRRSGQGAGSRDDQSCPRSQA